MNLYQKVITNFPKRIPFSFAYGSGVKPQLGYTAGERKMIDFIFCINEPTEWHSKNLNINSNHYSGLKIFGSNIISSYQKNFGAKIYYNTLVELKEPEIQIKYGIISIKDLIEDLDDWKYLYIAGRLHKPITLITDDKNPKIHRALQNNLQSALKIALMILPEMFSNYDLFYTISSLSYQGDFRMILGENKNKVENIVRAQLQEFQNLYNPIIEEFNLNVVNKTDNRIIYKQNKIQILKYIDTLPKSVKNNLIKFSGQNSFKNLAQDSEKLKKLLRKSINSLVWNSSITQSIKNIPTAGITKSLAYSWKKLLKSFS